MKLYVGNMSFDTTEQSLQVLFANYGDVQDVTIVTDRETGRARGFGFVFMEENGANSAMEALDDSEFEGRRINVSEARRRENRSGSG